MTTHIHSLFITVIDPQSALDFYKDGIGLEVRNDVKAGEFRWITLGFPGEQANIVLSQPHGGRSQIDGDALEALVSKGSMQAAIFITDDLDALFAKLVAMKFDVLQDPNVQPWGVNDCAFRDPSGNMVRIQQVAK